MPLTIYQLLSHFSRNHFHERCKVALVTGSGRGLGYAIAHRLAELGSDVALDDRSEEAPADFGEFNGLTHAPQTLAVLGVRTCAVIGDIASETETLSLVNQVISALGPISILVNCAGGDIAAKGGKPVPNNALGVPIEDVRADLRPKPDRYHAHLSCGGSGHGP